MTGKYLAKRAPEPTIGETQSPRPPVSRVLCQCHSAVYVPRLGLPPTGQPGGDHLSSPDVAARIERPTRGRAGSPCPPIRPCSRWGLPGLQCYHQSGELLPRPFTLTPRFRGGMFLWHFPSGHPAPPLAGILPGGARTFLPSVPFIRTGRTAAAQRSRARVDCSMRLSRRANRDVPTATSVRVA